MATTTYTNFNGRIVHENRGGTQRDYMRDPLGSTAALLDAAGNESDRWEYWPYGEIAFRSGSNPTPFTFVGTLGYFKDFAILLYIMARYLRTDVARWLTVDPLWPDEAPYGYVRLQPTFFTDISGLAVTSPMPPPVYFPPTTSMPPPPNLPGGGNPSGSAPAACGGDLTLAGLFYIGAAIGEFFKPKPKPTTKRIPCQVLYLSYKNACSGTKGCGKLSAPADCNEIRNRVDKNNDCATKRLHVMVECDLDPNSEGPWTPNYCGHASELCKIELQMCGCASLARGTCSGIYPPKDLCNNLKASCAAMSAKCPGKGFPTW